MGKTTSIFGRLLIPTRGNVSAVTPHMVDYDAAAQEFVELMADRKSATRPDPRALTLEQTGLLQERIQELEGEVVMLRDLNSVTEQLLVDAETRLRDREPPF